jgi:hypothetical protein
MQHNHKSFQAERPARVPESVWVVGTTGSGKTTHLIQQIRQLQQAAVSQSGSPSVTIKPASVKPMLVFSASGESGLALAERLVGIAACEVVTPIRFFETEVNQFWSLLQPQLKLKQQATLRLHPETEQDLAARLWRPELESGKLRQTGVSDGTTIERMLNLLRLAAASGTPHEQIALVLEEGLDDPEDFPLWQAMGQGINQWWSWCLEKGFLTYSILTELYWRYLLPQPAYQQQLKQRYQAVFADDVDEYPAVMRSLLEFFLDQKLGVVATFNPHGGARLGLGADPEHLAGLAERCRIVSLEQQPEASLGAAWGQVAIDWIQNPLLLPQLPDSIQLIQTVSKAQLLRQTAETIASAIQAGTIQPQDVAIVSPGLDAITRYTLQEILNSKGIPLTCLNLQQPVIRSPFVRALLTLLALIYPNLGRLAEREAVAEMLVILSQVNSETNPASLPEFRRANLVGTSPSFKVTADEEAFLAQPLPFKPWIDPVRAGLLADYCFVPDAATPQLLPATSFSRWDRLGYAATQTYGEILQWISAQQRSNLSLPELLNRAIQRFVPDQLTYDQHSVLQEFTQAAQHYWEVETRLQRRVDPTAVAERFITLLRAGTITGNPATLSTPAAVTLSTIYQYRNARCSHRWQFWIDAGSSFWLSGSAILFNAPLFLRQRLNRVWTAADALAADQDYLEREVLDLLGRAKERVYLCHCDLAVNGQEQTGPLMPLINGAIPVSDSPMTVSSS